MQNIVLGISGGIAIYKVAQLASDLSKNYNLKVIMTENAQKFMSTEVFEVLSQNKVYTDTFSAYLDKDKYKIPHVELSKWSDLIVLAPATANLIGKFANGIADDLLTTTLIAARSKVLLCPAMNSYMLTNPATQANLDTLKARGVAIMPTAKGELACGDYGSGKFPEPKLIEDKIAELLNLKADLAGLNVLITAGPTREKLDPVRFITNYSSGKMGYALAEASAARGAKVKLISGPSNLEASKAIELISVESAEEMFTAVKNNLAKADIVIMAAAVSDYRPLELKQEKLKNETETVSVDFVKNKDILAYAGQNRSKSTVVCGFSMETENLIENSKKKLLKKDIDLIVANNLRDQGAGFATDTNKVTLISKDEVRPLNLKTKTAVAHDVLDSCLAIYKEKN